MRKSRDRYFKCHFYLIMDEIEKDLFSKHAATYFN